MSDTEEIDDCPEMFQFHANNLHDMINNPQSIFKGINNCFKSIINCCLSLVVVTSILVTLIGKGLFLVWDWSMNKLGRKRIIMDRQNKEPYLVRYYLLFTDRKEFPFNIFIHKFIKGDEDDLHDHPWGFFSLILAGGYNETTLNKEKQKTTVWRGRGSFHSVKANHIHRISLEPNAADCWTLFIPFKRERKWGFWKQEKSGPVTRSAAAADKEKEKESTETESEFVWVSAEKYLKEKST